MLGSFAEAANGLDRDDYRRVAVRNAEFILSRMQRNGRLLRTYKDGEAKLAAYLEDYAYLIDALVSLYEATFDLRWIKEAQRLSEILTGQFWDGSAGGFSSPPPTTRPSSAPEDFITPRRLRHLVAAHALLRWASRRREPDGLANSAERMMGSRCRATSSAFGNCAHLISPRQAQGDRHHRRSARSGDTPPLRTIFIDIPPTRLLLAHPGRSFSCWRIDPDRWKPTVYVRKLYLPCAGYHGPGTGVGAGSVEGRLASGWGSSGVKRSICGPTGSHSRYSGRERASYEEQRVTDLRRHEPPRDAFRRPDEGPWGFGSPIR